MIRNTSYRLAEYKIIENEYGALWWERHFGLCSFQMGTCSIRGNILFIEPNDTEEPGFLKGEFLDHIRQLPKWENTKYYCTYYIIYNCRSGRKSPLKEMGVRSGNRTAITANGFFPGAALKKRYDGEQLDTIEDIPYKLDRYEIMEKHNGQVWWRTHCGRSDTKGGRCFIEGNILFFGPGKSEKTDILKKDFMERLIRLPAWEKTRYYCPSHTIYHCKTEKISREIGVDEELSEKTNGNNAIVNKEVFDGGSTAKPISLAEVITKVKEKVIGALALFKDCLDRFSR